MLWLLKFMSYLLKTFGPWYNMIWLWTSQVVDVWSIALFRQWSILMLVKASWLIKLMYVMLFLISIAFLNGFLDMNVVMAQPRSFVDPQLPQPCLQTKMFSLWFKISTPYMVWLARPVLSFFEFHSFKVDTSLFILYFIRATIFMLVNVNDILPTSDNIVFL